MFQKSTILIALVVVLSWLACTEPVKPNFALGEAFYLVEGRIVAGQGENLIQIKQSNFREVSLKFEPVIVARVLSVEASGRMVSWELKDAETGTYQPEDNFEARPGETWHFDINIDGTRVVSDPETIPEPAELNALAINFEQNAVFSAGRDRFIPQFELLVDFTDPAGIPNYYGWEVSFWEKIDVCASCVQGVWRSGECIPVTDRFVFRHDYYCDPPTCFQYEEVDQVLVSNDAFSDGQTVSSFPVGGIDFDDYGGLLAVVRSVNLSAEAYAYDEIISALVNGQNGLNATIPAALNGNVRNTDPDGTLVLGYLRAVSATEINAYIERTLDTGVPLPFDPIDRLENPLLRAPCDGPNRSTEPPPGWP